MGILDFVKSAGKALGIGSADAAEPPPAEALKKEIESHWLDASGLTVETRGDTVVLTGKAKSQEEKEKAIISVGNVAGVAKVDEKVEVPDAKEPVFHTVAKGDNLWKIAEKYLGSGARNKEIFEANRPMLSDPDKIYPGQVLRIPAR
jgi:nucleoid-associated protein YgaU